MFTSPLAPFSQPPAWKQRGDRDWLLRQRIQVVHELPSPAPAAVVALAALSAVLALAA